MTVVVAATVGVIGPVPLRAQANNVVTGVQPAPKPTAVPPVIPYAYYRHIEALQPRDTRTSRQKCLDEETEKVGGAPSDLDQRAIDLKCSQR